MNSIKVEPDTDSLSESTFSFGGFEFFGVKHEQNEDTEEDPLADTTQEPEIKHNMGEIKGEPGSHEQSCKTGCYSIDAKPEEKFLPFTYPVLKTEGMEESLIVTRIKEEVKDEITPEEHEFCLDSCEQILIEQDHGTSSVTNDGESPVREWEKAVCHSDTAEDLLAQNLTITGTLRKNRKGIPKELLESRQREEKSSVFAYTDEMTAVSYIPKRKKIVLLLSTQHHDPIILHDHPNKIPEIINHYNETKTGVDLIDQMVRKYTCTRGTRRWPFRLFMNIIEELSTSLVKPHIVHRMQNSSSLQKHIIRAAASLGITENHIPNQVTEASVSRKRGRCHLCERKNDVKTDRVCSSCNEWVCNKHLKKTVILKCETCL